uniref:Uncharacterized protein n=1 Tax=Crassostrea virginica TaxID=6565 RepID=A0A8B8D2G4_CRAVI|nr:putative uncharacterized protein DDB_G0287457 isoform X1 [Crassostrea virginica]
MNVYLSFEILIICYLMVSSASSCRKNCKKYNNKNKNYNKNNNKNNNNNNNNNIQTVNTHAWNPCIFGPGCGNTLVAAAFDRRLKASQTMLDDPRNSEHNWQPSISTHCVREINKTNTCFQVKGYNITLCFMKNTEGIFNADTDYYMHIRGNTVTVICGICCVLPDKTKQYTCIQQFCVNREKACIS